MADTPTPNAILADELEALAGDLDSGDAAHDPSVALLRAAAAALRAPTITADPVVREASEMLKEIRKTWSSPAPKAQLMVVISMLEAALATPSPTIAADELGLADDAAFLRVMADGATILSDRDDAERLWPETRETLRDIAESLVAAYGALRAPTIAADDARPPSSEGVEAIAAERRRQVTAEGWTPEHDDEHGEGDLVAAAICYAEDAFWGPRGDPKPRDGWPWDAKWWKPKGKLRNLARAGALLAAEFDRTVRQARHGASDRLEAALATPSPTIAAPSPSAIELFWCTKCGSFGWESSDDEHFCGAEFRAPATEVQLLAFRAGREYERILASFREAALKARKPSPSQADDAET